MNLSILLIGNDTIFRNLYSIIGNIHQTYKANPIAQDVILQLKKNTINIAIIVEDMLEDKDTQDIKNILRLNNIPWCYVLTCFNEIILSPIFQCLLKEQGCDCCLKMRFINNQKDRVNFRLLKQKNNHLLSYQPSLITEFALKSMLALILQISHSLDSLNLNNSTVYVLNINSLEVTKHSFIQHPLCPKCSKLPGDNKNLAKIKIESRVLNNNSYRVKQINSNFYNSLVNNFVDTKVGVFNTVLDDVNAPFSVSVANLPIFNGLNEPGIGRALRYQDSRIVAILEGLERYAGFEPKGKKTMITSDYESVKDMAINPKLFGTHSEKQYSSDKFPFKPFDPAQQINWVWAYSFMKNKPVLIPEFCSYYGYFLEKGYRNASFYEISNGCSLGGCVEEAILHGIFEVIERDAFLISWYSKLPLQEIDITGIQDQEFQFMLTRFQNETNYGLKFFNMTFDLKIPCIWVIARNRKVDNRVNLLCAAGCHVDPIRALKSALHEITGILVAMQEKYLLRKSEALEMLMDSNKVLKMEDHSLVNGLQEAEYRLDFLLNSRSEKIRFDSIQSKHFGRYNDLKPLLADIIGSIKRSGMDIICVDQTTLEMKLNDLSCVKVLIPGMLPMTFGYNMNRITGLSRLYDVPYKLGYYNKRLKEDEINQYPHPFP